ncbi:hypothetical protein Ae201684P_017595 [Aphanomyces euteiches]|uniref:Uncharacterized protein n=1 Tax=Aphanomyces euteiches TaxID=100861 RepID=A0A6G0XME5_9STRA|nr:hypothetical protein Ae201684_003234 [Aphanomyces euteiches]KAH9098381.1 hypothetical protein Ae201684P_017595 [Aphanomyces euteiches]
MSTTCLFNGCTNPALPTGKCEAHKNRTKCMVDDCRNQTYARNLCIKHGAKQKCQFDGCNSNVRSQGFCCKHGLTSSKNVCEVDGCTKVAHARRRCVRHGGGQKCKIDNCSKFARSGGICYHHGSALRQSPAASEPCPDDDNILACILGDVHLMELKNVDDILAASCNCDFEFTTEEHEMLDYFISP